MNEMQYWVKFKPTINNMANFTRAVILTSSAVKCFSYGWDTKKLPKNAIFALTIQNDRIETFKQISLMTLEEIQKVVLK